MRVFKVRDKATGLYSSGGYCPAWSSQGKSWRTIGQVRSALKMYRRGQYGEVKKIPASWEVVEVEVVITVVKTQSASDLITGYRPPPAKRPLRRRR